MTKNEDEDQRHMSRALGLARAQLGLVWPNPAVGCVLVKDGVVVGEGATQKGGRPHAEAVALLEAGARAEGATAYVTLEPCSHTGRTPPCADALIEAGIARCVISLADLDARVDGSGIDRLKTEGVAVELGLLEDAAAVTNEGFFHLVETGKPKTYVVQSVTDEIVASLDAILISVRTFLQDPTSWKTANLIVLIAPTASDRDKLAGETTVCDPDAWIIVQSSDDRLAAHFAKVIEINELLPNDMCSSSVLKKLGEVGLTRLGVVEDSPTKNSQVSLKR